MFWRRKVEPPADPHQLLARVERLESTLRSMNDEMVALHDRVHRWMRRAVAAESAVGRRPSQLSGERNPEALRVASIVESTLAGLRGARRRIAERSLRERGYVVGGDEREASQTPANGHAGPVTLPPLEDTEPVTED